MIRGLEAEPHADLDLPLDVEVVLARDPHEVRAVDVAVRIPELRRVRDVRRLDPQLEPARRADRERPEDAQIEVDASRAADRAAARVSKAHALRLRPRAGVVVRPAAADLAELFD